VNRIPYDGNPVGGSTQLVQHHPPLAYYQGLLSAEMGSSESVKTHTKPGPDGKPEFPTKETSVLDL
jgi:hypothetical protein